MRGAWARHVVAALGGERAGAVTGLRVEPGAVSGEVDGCHVALLAPLVPEGVWRSVVRFARNRASLRTGVEGTAQSEPLEHLLAEDWEEPLVPASESIARVCACGEPECAHVPALARALADEIDRDPSALLRWRGCVEDPAAAGDPWRGGPLPELDPARPWPAGTILLRLGESGVAVGERDLAAALRRAYDAFAG